MQEVLKLSEFVKNFTVPEEEFEARMTEAGFPTPPPGPAKAASQLMEQIETTIAAGEFPAPPAFPAFPFPEFPFGGGTGEGKGKGESLGEVVEVEETRKKTTPRKSAVEVEIIEA